MIYDLTHTLTSGISHFPGDPEPRVEPIISTPPWQVSVLQVGSHSGTHIDAPLHYLPHGRGIGEYDLERFIRPGVVVDARGYEDDQPIGAGVLEGYTIAPGACLVLRTGWEAYWGNERYFRHPYLSDDLAGALVARGVTLLAIDALNVDTTPVEGASVHDRLLRADVLIVENLCGLGQLTSATGYIFAFLPLALGHLDGAPIRALAWDTGHVFSI
jgi:kynurenine formamidase